MGTILTFCAIQPPASSYAEILRVVAMYDEQGWW